MLPVRTGGRTGLAAAGHWLESAYLARVTARAGHHYGLGAEDISDLLQEVHIALWQKGLATKVGPPWIRKVARNKAVDFLRRRLRARAHDQAFATIMIPARHDNELDRLLHARAEPYLLACEAFSISTTGRA